MVLMLFADPFVSCAAAPTTLGFEDLQSGLQASQQAASGPNGETVTSNITYAGLTFAASAAATYPASLTTFLTIVNSGTEEYPIIESGTKGFEASFLEYSGDFGIDPPFTQSLNIADSGTNGAFVPVSAYVNGLVSNGAQGINVSVSSFLASATTCQESITTEGHDPTGPTKLSLRAPNGGGCVADTLSFITSNAMLGSGGTPIRLSLDEFVVCKANAASGLQGVLGHG